MFGRMTKKPGRKLTKIQSKAFKPLSIPPLLIILSKEILYFRLIIIFLCALLTGLFILLRC